VPTVARISPPRNGNTPMPITLSDRQSTAVASAAAALPPADRDGSYQAVAHRLTGREVGDGAVGRAIATPFQLYFKAAWSSCRPGSSAAPGCGSPMGRSRDT
jgi:hypothetical protein